MTPDRIPPERLRKVRCRAGEAAQFPGLKEEYYLADFEPDPASWSASASTRTVTVVIRPPPDVSLYHRRSNRLFPQVCRTLGSDDGVHAIVVPRTEEQRDFVERSSSPR